MSSSQWPQINTESFRGAGRLWSGQDTPWQGVSVVGQDTDACCGCVRATAYSGCQGRRWQLPWPLCMTIPMNWASTANSAAAQTTTQRGSTLRGNEAAVRLQRLPLLRCLATPTPCWAGGDCAASPGYRGFCRGRRLPPQTDSLGWGTSS